MAHILLIEPDRVLAETYTQSLKSAGHSVTPCASAQSAILAADKNRPDLVILEIQLIEHSGIEFLYEFRSYSDWQSIPIIIHSIVPGLEFNNNRKILREQLKVENYLDKQKTSLAELVKRVNASLQLVS